MQICSICHTSSPDSAAHCRQCQADLSVFSENSQSLKRIQENPRIQYLRISVSHDCCPACREAEGAYPKDKAVKLPVEGCSHSMGCRCTYLPVLDVLYP